MYAYSSILAALLHRQQTGRGQHIDISMLESLVEWMSYPLYYAFDGAAPPPRTGASHATIYPYGPFPAGDGKVVMLGLQNEREWAAFCDKVLLQPRAREGRALLARNSKRSAARDGAAQAHRRGVRGTHRRAGRRAARRRADRQRAGQHDARRLGASAAAGAQPLARGRHAGRTIPALLPPGSWEKARRAWTRCPRSASTPTRSSAGSATRPSAIAELRAARRRSERRSRRRTTLTAAAHLPLRARQSPGALRQGARSPAPTRSSSTSRTRSLRSDKDPPRASDRAMVCAASAKQRSAVVGAHQRRAHAPGCATISCPPRELASHRRCCRRRKRQAQIERVAAALPAGGTVLPIIEIGARRCRMSTAVAAARRCSSPRLRHARLRGRPRPAGRRARPALYREPHGIRIASRCAGHRRRRSPASRRASTTRAAARRPCDFARASASAPSCAFIRSRSPSIQCLVGPTATEVDWARRVLACGRRQPGRGTARRQDGRPPGHPQGQESLGPRARLPSAFASIARRKSFSQHTPGSSEH